ncbi:cellulose biosynthesis protein BcsS [Bosea sp. (in: a-proteobacteria)]|uniref:cellulose biosynthesis protein BcsS n=1 Tax=Bosea sp. (in: a-proteobacteria) TaxID=1871050 RepID=UPI003F715C87
MACRCAELGRARLAALAGVLVAAPALAEDDDFSPPSPVSAVLFGSLEAGASKTLATIGIKQAWGGAGLDASGFRTLMKIGAAREGASRTRPRGIAYKAESQALFGYEWRFGDNFIALYAGPDVEAEYREQWNASSYIVRMGPRLQADLWARPTGTTMVQAAAYLSSLDRRAWLRVAPGWAIRQDLYAGPEIELYRQDGYHKLRVGLHLTGLRLFGLTWRLAGGWQRTNHRSSEAYATLGLHWRR